MPTSIVVRSGVCPDSYIEYDEQFTETGTVNSNGLDYLHNGYSQSITRAITSNNAVSQRTGEAGVSYVSAQSLSYTPDTFSQTISTVPPFSGQLTSITFPKYLPSWQSPIGLNGFGWLLAGNVRIDFTLVAQSNYRSDYAYWNVDTDGGVVVRPDATTIPIFSAGGVWQPYLTNDPMLISGHEPYVVRSSLKPGDAGYRIIGFDPGYRTATTGGESFHYRSDAERPMVGNSSDGGQDHAVYDSLVPNHNPYGQMAFYNWATGSLSAGGTTNRAIEFVLYYNDYSGIIPQIRTPATAGASVTRSYHWKYRVTMTGMQFIIYIGFGGETSVDTTGGEPVAVDVFEDKFIACAWCSASGTNGKKQLYIGIQPALTSNMGSGSGSTGGWETYLFGDIDTRSEVGLCYLPSGKLEVMFDEYDVSGVKTKKYIVNPSFGRKPLSNWSARATVSADGSQSLSAGRAMGQAWKLRAGS